MKRPGKKYSAESHLQVSKPDVEHRFPVTAVTKGGRVVGSGLVMGNAKQLLACLSGTSKEREEGNDNGGTESPSDRHKDPEGKVRLSEDLSRDREDRPHDDKHEGEEVSTTDNPALGTTDLILVKDVIGESSSILLNEVDVGIKSPRGTTAF